MSRFVGTLRAGSWCSARHSPVATTGSSLSRRRRARVARLRAAGPVGHLGSYRTSAERGSSPTGAEAATRSCRRSLAPTARWRSPARPHATRSRLAPPGRGVTSRSTPRRSSPADSAIDSRGCEVILEDTDIRDAAPAGCGFGDGLKLVPQPEGEGRAQIARLGRKRLRMRRTFTVYRRARRACPGSAVKLRQRFSRHRQQPFDNDRTRRARRALRARVSASPRRLHRKAARSLRRARRRPSRRALP